MHRFWVMSSSKAFRLDRAGPGRITPKMDSLSENKYFLFLHHMCTINIFRDMELRKIQYMSPEKSAIFPRFARFRSQPDVYLS